MIKFEKLPADILSRIPEAAKVLQADGNVVFAYLFGGLAEGRLYPLSDVDIAVCLKSTADLAEYKLDLFSHLSDALGTGEIDLLILNTAPVSITGRIMQNKRLLVDKEPFRRHAYESLTLRKFFDFRIKENLSLAGKYRVG